ncbi:MAG TPA: 5'-3' exonuclease H3TH domain-containing protein [Acidimicrobiales bacterium]|nr:5'-3' exonuclease H3TH domain-containing protein [Acidimicrobiales bacterium]
MSAEPRPDPTAARRRATIGEARHHNDGMRVHLVDGTYELFRHHYGLPAEIRATPDAAVRSVVEGTVALLEDGVTHIGVATDHVIESFRNELWPDYKSSAGMDPAILEQFGPLEEALSQLGVTVWAMTDLEADDALASASTVAAEDDEVEQVCILTADKDLAQMVRGTRVVQVDRRQRRVIDHDGVVDKFGVGPESIPDLLALVGDQADGFPGLPGWGMKSAATVLARYRHIADIPDDPGSWDVGVRGAPRLAGTLRQSRELAALFLELATLRLRPSLVPTVESLRWHGPQPGLAHLSERWGVPELTARVEALASSR